MGGIKVFNMPAHTFAMAHPWTADHPPACEDLHRQMCPCKAWKIKCREFSPLPCHGPIPLAHGQGRLARAKGQASARQVKAQPVIKSGVGRAESPGWRGRSVSQRCERNLCGAQGWEGRVGPRSGKHNARQKSQQNLSRLFVQVLSPLGMNCPGILSYQAARLRLEISWAKIFHPHVPHRAL